MVGRRCRAGRTSRPRRPAGPRRRSRRRPARRARPRRPRRTAAGLVDDEDPAGGGGLADEVGRGQRGQPAQVDHAARRCPRSASRAADPQRHPHPVAEGDDRQVARRRRRTPGPARSGRGRAAHSSGAAYGAASRRRRRMQVTGVVQRDRLQEDADAAVDLGRGEAGAQHRRRLGRPGRHGDDQPGDVAQHGHRVVVVEVPAEALLVRQPGDPHHHRVAVRAAGEELHAWRPRRAAGPRRCAGRPGTGSPVRAAARPARRRAPSPRIEVSSSSVSKTRPAPNRSRSPLVTPYTPPLTADVLAEDQHPPGWSSSASVSVGVDGLCQGQRAGLLRQLAAERLGPGAWLGPPAASAASATARATRTGRRGASGATTSAAVASFGSPRPPRRPGAPASPPRRSGRAASSGREQPGLDQQSRGRHQRVAVQVGGDLGWIAVAELGVGAGVTHQPDHGQVQHGGPAVAADPLGGRLAAAS